MICDAITPLDAQMMEQSLIRVADAGTEIREPLFDRFFATYPGRRPIFYNLTVSSRRMTDETVQMIYGLATGEKWVWPLVSELMFTHRNYGYLPNAEYDAFIDMTVDALRDAGSDWSPECDAVWRKYAGELKALIASARDQWETAMPGQMTAKEQAA